MFQTLPCFVPASPKQFGSRPLFNSSGLTCRSVAARIPERSLQAAGSLLTSSTLGSFVSVGPRKDFCRLKAAILGRFSPLASVLILIAGLWSASAQLPVGWTDQDIGT